MLEIDTVIHWYSSGHRLPSRRSIWSPRPSNIQKPSMVDSSHCDVPDHRCFELDEFRNLQPGKLTLALREVNKQNNLYTTSSSPVHIYIEHSASRHFTLKA